MIAALQAFTLSVHASKLTFAGLGVPIAGLGGSCGTLCFPQLTNGVRTIAMNTFVPMPMPRPVAQTLVDASFCKFPADSSEILSRCMSPLASMSPGDVFTAAVLAKERGDTDNMLALLLGGIAGGAAVYLAPTAVGWVLGISPAGPLKGGVFAFLQSTFGNIQAGSTLAQTQSFVMGGASTKSILIGAGLGATLAEKLTDKQCILTHECNRDKGFEFRSNPKLQSKL